MTRLGQICAYPLPHAIAARFDQPRTSWSDVETDYIYGTLQFFPATATRGSGVDFLRISTCGGLFSGGLFNK